MALVSFHSWVSRVAGVLCLLTAGAALAQPTPQVRAQQISGATVRAGAQPGTYDVSLLVLHPVSRATMTAPRFTVSTTSPTNIDVTDPVSGLAASVRAQITNNGRLLEIATSVRQGAILLRGESLALGLASDN